MNCLLRCSCGKVKGTVETAKFHNRCVCYCKTCQAFAHFLNKAEDVLDRQGGTAILQTVPNAVHISEGKEEIRCMSLKKGGLLRWYTKCCNTAIGNTPANYKIPFVGLIQACLSPQAGSTLDKSFGPIKTRVNTQSAKEEPKPKASSALGIMLKFMPILFKARLNGSYKKTPFFSPEGTPVVIPNVLDEAEYKKLLQSL